MNLEQLRARLAEIQARLRAINTEAGDNQLSDEQATEWTALEAEHNDVRDQITEAERRQRIEESRARWSSIEVGQSVPTEAGDVMRLSRPEIRDRSLKALESRDLTAHLETRQVEGVERLIRTRNRNIDGAMIGRMLLASETEEYHSAFLKYVNGNPAFTHDEARAIEQVRAAHESGTGADTSGGFGVPVLIDPTIIMTSQGSSNVVRQIARIETITTNKWKGVSTDGMSASWDTEASRVSDDTPTLAQPEVEAFLARVFLPYSVEVGMDYPGFASEYGRVMAEGYDELQAEAFVSGSGSGAPTGIFTEGITKISVTTDGAFGGEDIGGVWAAVPERFRGNATWLMSTDVGNEVAGFGASNNLSFVTVNLAGMVETLRTRPVRYSDYAPDFTGTTGAANILVVGDFRNYLIADRAGSTVETIQNLFQQQTANSGFGLPTSQRGILLWARVGGGSINDNAFRILANT